MVEETSKEVIKDEKVKVPIRHVDAYTIGCLAHGLLRITPGRKISPYEDASPFYQSDTVLWDIDGLILLRPRTILSNTIPRSA